MTQIIEDYVSFESAKLLKEKGFDAPVKNYYSLCTEDVKYNLQKKYGAKKNWNSFALTISRPSQSLVMKWLREVHNYDISICLDSYVEPYDNEYYIVIRRRKVKFEEVSPCEQVYFKTYEEAAEAAIKYCLKNLI